MLHEFLKKKLKNMFFLGLIIFYKKHQITYFLLKSHNFYQTTLQVTLPQRQHYTSYGFRKVFKVQSTGLVLAQSNIYLKYYKRVAKSNTSHILYLQNNFLPHLKYIYLYLVKNFTYRQWLFFQKFLILINPNILIIQHKKSYNTNYRPIKRLKRRVLHLLLKH